MKRVALCIAGAIAVVALLVLLGLFWLLETGSGARFALETATGLAGMEFSAQKVEGQLRDRLRLTGVRLSQDKLKVQVDRLFLSWEPERLFRGKLLVHELAIAGVRIQDDTPVSAKAPDLRWPKVSDLVQRMDATVSRISVRDVTYRHLDAPPSRLEKLAASLTLKDGLLTVSGASVTSSQGSVSGELAAGLFRPSLRLDLRLDPAAPVAEMDAFSLQARLQPGNDPEQLAGPVALTGRNDGNQRLEATGVLGITNTGFNLRKLRVVQPGRSGTLTGSGSMTLTAAEPLFSLALEAKDLALSDELGFPAMISGGLIFSGTPADYSGILDLVNEVETWHKAQLKAQYRGGKERVKLAPLSGRWLDGRVEGALDIAWKEGVRVKGDLSGRKLDPSKLAADWSGLVNLDLSGVILVPEQGGVRGTLDAKLLDSRLQGRALAGEALASFTGEDVLLQRLYLAGKGFALRASGELDRRIDFVADVNDLSGLLPGAAGSLDAEGWLRWRDGQLAGALNGDGRNIAVGGTRMASVDLSARLGEGEGYPVYLRAAVDGLKVGRTRIDTALVTLDGTAARHALEATLSSGAARMQTAVNGSYRDGVWRGEITRLSGTDGVGPFALARPATLVVGDGGFTLSPLVVQGEPGERFQVAGSRGRDGAGSVNASWSAVNLARADLWLEGMEIDGRSSGNLDLRLFPGDRIALSGRAEAEAVVTVDGQRLSLERFVATVDGGRDGIDLAADLSLEGGAGSAHLEFASSAPAMLSVPERGDLELTWDNLDLALLKEYLPPDAVLQGRSAGRVTGELLPGARLDVEGEASIAEGHLNLLSGTEELDVSLDEAEAEFSWRDPAAGAPRNQGVLTLEARAAAEGSYISNGERILQGNATLRIDADPRGSRASVDLLLDEGGELRASFVSDAPATAGVPETGDLSLRWNRIKPELLRPWMPGALNLQGELYGHANGKLLPGRRLELAGQAGFSQGRATWQGEDGELSANLRSATLDFSWRGETLASDLSLALAEYGQARGNFVLPIPARLPVAPVQSGALRGSLEGRVQEKGFLTALAPGLVQETSGTVEVDLSLGGTWSEPSLTGNLNLRNAGAYVPSAGITLTEVELSARFGEDLIRIERLRAVSGGGELVGNMLLRMRGWEVAGYSGTLSGQRFQTVYLPELRMFASPQLTFEGDLQRLVLRGELGIPEMLITGPPTSDMITPSDDVVFVGTPPKAEEEGKFPLVLDGRVRVVLGDKVRVEASGIEARFGGGMDLVLEGVDNITSSGEIRVVEGKYSAYGVELDIVRGRIYYVDDPVNRPTLDILALRTVGDVKAGVTVGGYLANPVVKLYSEPPMPEVDILAYMVLGHPMGASGEQGSLLATAATSLLSFGQAESVTEEIKNRLGISTLGVETVNTSRGMMGYERISTIPEAGTPEPTGQSLFSVGKYLTPKLYLSYGRSLVTGESLVRLRWDIHRRWQVETQSGSESGADIYYKMEFN